MFTLAEHAAYAVVAVLALRQAPYDAPREENGSLLEPVVAEQPVRVDPPLLRDEHFYRPQALLHGVATVDPPGLYVVGEAAEGEGSLAAAAGAGAVLARPKIYVVHDGTIVIAVDYGAEAGAAADDPGGLLPYVSEEPRHHVAAGDDELVGSLDRW